METVQNAVAAFRAETLPPSPVLSEESGTRIAERPWLKRLRAPALLILALALLVWRQPDLVQTPQFYAEDGVCWYKQAHDLGAAALLRPHAGYLELLSRLVGMIAQALPIATAPVLFNLVALLMRALPIVFVFSFRMRGIFPSVGARLCAAGLLLAMPGSGEVTGNLTNAHTPLALLAAMIVLMAEPAETRVAQWLDCAVVILAGLSGPFGLPLALLTLVRHYWVSKKQAHSGEQRQGWTVAEKTLLASVAAQALVVLVIAPRLSAQDIVRHSDHNLGMSLVAGANLIGGKLMTAFLIGDTRFYASINHIADYPNTVPWNAPIAVATTLLGLALVVRACWKAPRELTLFVLFTGLTLAASLLFPLKSEHGPIWVSLVHILRNGNRYFFLAMVGFAFVLVRLAFSDPKKGIRLTAVTLLLVALFGAQDDWALPVLWDCGFRPAAVAYDQAAPGTRFVIPASPAKDWAFELTK